MILKYKLTSKPQIFIVINIQCWYYSIESEVLIKMKKVSFYLTDENKELLDNISFLKKESKVSLINKAIEVYLGQLVNENNLKEKLENLKKLT